MSFHAERGRSGGRGFASHRGRWQGRGSFASRGGSHNSTSWPASVAAAPVSRNKTWHRGDAAPGGSQPAAPPVSVFPSSAADAPAVQQVSQPVHTAEIPGHPARDKDNRQLQAPPAGTEAYAKRHKHQLLRVPVTLGPSAQASAAPKPTPPQGNSPDQRRPVSQSGGRVTQASATSLQQAGTASAAVLSAPVLGPTSLPRVSTAGPENTTSGASGVGERIRKSRHKLVRSQVPPGPSQPLAAVPSEAPSLNAAGQPVSRQPHQPASAGGAAGHTAQGGPQQAAGGQALGTASHTPTPHGQYGAASAQPSATPQSVGILRLRSKSSMRYRRSDTPGKATSAASPAATSFGPQNHSLQWLRAKAGGVSKLSMQARQGGAGGGLSGVGAARPSGTQQVTLLYRKSKDGFRLARAGIRSTARSPLTWTNAAAASAAPASIAQHTAHRTQQVQQERWERPAATLTSATATPGKVWASRNWHRLAAPTSKQFPSTLRRPAGQRAGRLLVVGGVKKQVPAKLRRIGKHLYSVVGSGPGQKLVRQRSLISAHKPKLAAAAASAASVQATPAGGSSAKLAKYMRKGATLTRLSSLGRTPVMSAASRTQRQSPLQALKSRLQRKQQKKGSSSVCLTFCRTGKCPGTKDGRCKLVHDPAKVAVCPRWLQGRCAEDACPLQHRRCPELMPVCTFFLQGLCSNGACSYLHVNLDPAAPVCEDFLNGYCAKGLHCSHKHLTARMVKELRQNKTFAAAGSGGGAKPVQAGPAPPTENSLAAEGPGFSEAIGLDAGRRHSSMHLRPAFLRNLTPAKVA